MATPGRCCGELWSQQVCVRSGIAQSGVQEQVWSQEVQLRIEIEITHSNPGTERNIIVYIYGYVRFNRCN